MPSDCPSIAGILDLLGERDWGELFLKGAAGCLIYTLTALWVAAPVGLAWGPRAAFNIFAALMNPPLALASRLFRAYMGRRGEREERHEERQFPAPLPMPLSNFLPQAPRPPPGFEPNPFLGRSFQGQP